MMNEVVVATFDSKSAAEAAVRDIEVAQFPCEVIARGVHDDKRERPEVSVSVAARHADAVAGILDQYGSVTR